MIIQSKLIRRHFWSATNYITKLPISKEIMTDDWNAATTISWQKTKVKIRISIEIKKMKDEHKI